MKAKLKANHLSKRLQDSQIMELSDLIELSDEELKMVVGGSFTTANEQILLDTDTTSSTICPTCWGNSRGGGSGGSGNGSGGGF